MLNSKVGSNHSSSKTSIQDVMGSIASLGQPTSPGNQRLINQINDKAYQTPMVMIMAEDSESHSPGAFTDSSPVLDLTKLDSSCGLRRAQVDQSPTGSDDVQYITKMSFIREEDKLDSST